MNNKQPLGEGKLFHASRRTRPSMQHRAVQADNLVHFADCTLLLLAVTLLVVVGIAGQFCLCGTWERARDFILIFLPATCLLMGAALAACFRS